MLTRPNIFNYAKKELSQDAVICWLLECCHSDDDKYRQIGIDFVRFILDNENIKEKDIELEKTARVVSIRIWMCMQIFVSAKQ